MAGDQFDVFLDSCLYRVLSFAEVVGFGFGALMGN